VAFHRLGLVVIDEQHRFGVEQRAALIGKGDGPDVLLLTATPIPRSLALTRYGDLDLSILRQKPPGRGSVRTTLRGPRQRDRVFDFVHHACTEGGQSYIVLPLIEESERADLRAAKVLFEQLTKRWPDLSVGLVHGQLKPEERDRVMRDFRAGQIKVLVATTVIEVGIDVPNATIMVIDHPERFGLAQLHQLRGRVGRGAGESHCILLSPGHTPPRLKAFAQTDDGFRIAELDLQERQQGDLMGQRQHGAAEIRIARFPDDSELLQKARSLAERVLAKDPALESRENAGLRARAIARYPRAEILFRIG
jgi:ATP-dependent DNA helicase RecG